MSSVPEHSPEVDLPHVRVEAEAALLEGLRAERALDVVLLSTLLHVPLGVEQWHLLLAPRALHHGVVLVTLLPLKQTDSPVMVTFESKFEQVAPTQPKLNGVPKSNIQLTDKWWIRIPSHVRDQLRGEAGLELAALALELAPEVLRLHVDVQRVDVHEADAAQLAHRQRRLPARLGRSLVPPAVLVAAPPLSACMYVESSNAKPFIL